MSKVFISYRREDAAGFAQAIFGQLERHLRRDQIFMDVDTVEPGVDFVTRIEEAVGESDVVIALIGKRWMGEREKAPPRIHDPFDFVHLEIAAALARDIKVIPILVDGASMPNKDQLPRTLQLLVRRNALELSHTRFRFDLERVSQAVQKALSPTGVKKKADRQRRPWMWYGGLSAVLIVLGIAVGLWFKWGEDKQTEIKRDPERMVVLKKPPSEEAQPVAKEQPKSEALIVALLARAKTAEDKLRLTTPAEDNANNYYRKVLQLDPDNPDAQQGLKRIGEKYIASAEQALGQRQFDKAVENLQKAASVTPDHPALAEFRGRLEEEKAREADLARAKAERKKQEELRLLAAAKATFVPGTVFRDRLKIGGDGPQMVVIPSGTFQMGDIQGSGDKDEQPVHAVRIQKHFAIGRYEVTFNDYDRFAKARGKSLPSDHDWGRGQRPVINVSWQDALEYAKWLSDQTGKRYRLPTEAEWEYATRAGTETAYYWGNNLINGMANCAGCGSQWDSKQPAPVGSFKPNKFGLYDTAGNVWEWVEDCWYGDYTGAPTDGSAWLERGGGKCGRRVIRGGSWHSTPEVLRTSYRLGYNAVDGYIGFRLAQDLP